LLHQDDVGPAARLDRRGRARRQVVGVDRLDVELDAERLLHFGRVHLAQHFIRGRNEVVPAQDMHRVRLREDRSAVGSQDAGDPGGAGCLQELATIESLLHCLLLQEGFGGPTLPQ